MNEDDFEKLSSDEKLKEIHRVDETERRWFVSCPRCKFRMIGTLAELRGKPCGACGHGKQAE